MFTKKTKVALYTVCIFAIMLPAFVQAQWARLEVTTGLGWVQETHIAEGRNDGVKRVYLASPGSMGVFECTWNGVSYDRIQVGSSSDQLRDVYVGRGRNDTIMRVYTADEGTTLLEHTWTGAIWTQDTVGRANALGVFVGEGRNDGVIRVYASKQYGADDNFIYEYTWQGNSWSVDSMQGGTDWFYKPVLGNGRNDDTIRVYGSCRDRHVYEFTWNGAMWDVTDVADSVFGNDITIGPGRDDGINRLYCANSNGHMLEYTWNGSNWDKTSDEQPSGSTYMREVYVGDGRNDGVNRVYGTGQNSGLVEYTWSGTNWQLDVMGVETDAVTVGDGRDDGIMRVYAASASAVAEYNHVTGVFEDTHESLLSINVHPNPFRDKARITYNVGSNAKDAQVKIYDVTGQLVKDLSQLAANNLSGTISWDGTDQVNRKLPGGIYFVEVDGEVAQKITKIH